MITVVFRTIHFCYIFQLAAIPGIAVKGTQRAGQVDLSLRAGSSEAGEKKTFLNHHLYVTH